MLPVPTSAATPPPVRGADQLRAMLARSRAAVALQARQVVLDHAHDFLHSTTTGATDARAMADALATDSGDADPVAHEIARILHALEADLVAVVDKHGAALRAVVEDPDGAGNGVNMAAAGNSAVELHFDAVSEDHAARAVEVAVKREDVSSPMPPPPPRRVRVRRDRTERTVGGESSSRDSSRGSMLGDGGLDPHDHPVTTTPAPVDADDRSRARDSVDGDAHHVDPTSHAPQSSDRPSRTSSGPAFSAWAQSLEPTLRASLLRNRIGKLLISPNSPFTITRDPRDGVSVTEFRVLLGIAANSSYPWDANLMAAVGLAKSKPLRSCAFCMQQWSADRQCCDQWEELPQERERRRFVTGLRRRGVDESGVSVQGTTGEGAVLVELLPVDVPRRRTRARATAVTDNDDMDDEDGVVVVQRTSARARGDRHVLHGEVTSDDSDDEDGDYEEEEEVEDETHDDDDDADDQPPHPPFIVTGSAFDGISMRAIRTALGMPSRGGPFPWPTAALAAVGVHRHLGRQCCAACEHMTSIDNPCACVDRGEEVVYEHRSVATVLSRRHPRRKKDGPNRTPIYKVSLHVEALDLETATVPDTRVLLRLCKRISAELHDTFDPPAQPLLPLPVQVPDLKTAGQLGQPSRDRVCVLLEHRQSIARQARHFVIEQTTGFLHDALNHAADQYNAAEALAAADSETAEADTG
ncbi:hypothetical protein GGF32_001190 [Allomyces javanicus]|nr:hypothetical protein GGF32_001190 [Allomyces javanicus]